MRSPFPGMDPYFEDPAYWEAFHHQFISECSNHLSERLGPGYVANITERVELISYDDPAARQYIPDVSVARERRARPSDAVEAGGVAVALEPVTIPAIEEIEVREASIHILRLPDYQLVTVIEVLSPSNKFGEGIGEYRRKRSNLVGGGVHFLEIDLLVRGQRTELARPLPAGDYYAMIFRADRRPDVDVWAWSVRQSLPTALPVPLKVPDPPVLFDLAAVVSAVYERGVYGRKLRYHLPCPAPVAPADGAWAEGVARGAMESRQA